MAKVSKTFVDQTLWPEFAALDTVLQDHLDEVTNKIISEAVYAHNEDLKEVQALT